MAFNNIGLKSKEKEQEMWNWQSTFWDKNNEKFDRVEREIASIGDSSIFNGHNFLELLSNFYANYIKVNQREFDSFNKEWWSKSLNLLLSYFYLK